MNAVAVGCASQQLDFPRPLTHWATGGGPPRRGGRLAEDTPDTVDYEFPFRGVRQEVVSFPNITASMEFVKEFVKEFVHKIIEVCKSSFHIPL